MQLIKCLALVGTMAISMNGLAAGGDDRNFERAFSVNALAMEQYAAALGKAPPVIKEYVYGMKLDVAKIVSTVPPQSACTVVPTAMTYEDSKGQLNTLKYSVAGECSSGGS